MPARTLSRYSRTCTVRHGPDNNYGLGVAYVFSALGHIDLTVALSFMAGLVPGSLVRSRLAQRFASDMLRIAFG
jgi:uncharacterized membrane protein YfcA